MVAFVDVDHTLILHSGREHSPNPVVVEHVRKLKADGIDLYCWSAGGADYAREMARSAGVEEVFTAFLPKPRVMIDDQRVADWPFCVTVPPEWCEGKDWQSYLKEDLD